MKRLLALIGLGVFCMTTACFGVAIFNGEAYQAAMRADRQEAASHYPDIDARLELSIYKYGMAMASGTNDTGSGAYVQPDNVYTVLNASNQFTIANPITAAPPQFVFNNASGVEFDNGSTTVGWSLKNTGNIATGTTPAFNVFGGSSDVSLFTVQGNGNVNDVTGNFKGTSNAAGVGGIDLGGSSPDANCTGGCLVFGAAGGTWTTGSHCLVQASNAGAVTITSPICTVETGAANTATSFVVTLPWAFGATANTVCQIQLLVPADTFTAGTAAGPCQPTSTQTVTVGVFSAAPGNAVNLFTVIVGGNGP